MSRKLNVVRYFRIASVKGLEPPSYASDCLPLLWHELGTHKRPSIVRWAWQPQTGHLHIGVQHRHKFQIPKSAEYPYASWLRGFYFWREKTLAVRPYYWPENLNDWWDERHEKLHVHVAFCFIHAIRPALPLTTTTLSCVDNKTLREKFGHLALDW